MRCLIELVDLHKMVKNVYLFQLNGEVFLLFFSKIIFRSMLLRKISQHSYFASFYKPKHRIFKLIWHLNNIFFSIAKYIAFQHDSKRLRVRKSLSRNQIVFVFLSQNRMYFFFIAQPNAFSRSIANPMRLITLSQNPMVFLFLSQNPMYFIFVSHNPMRGCILSQNPMHFLILSENLMRFCILSENPMRFCILL